MLPYSILVAYTREEIGFQWWPALPKNEHSAGKHKSGAEASIFNQQEKEGEETLDAIFTTQPALLLETVQDFWLSQDCTSEVLALRGNTV